MLTKSQIANGVLVATLAYDLYAARKNKTKFNELQEMNDILLNELNNTLYRNQYMANLLDTNEILMTEFDQIAMNNPM
jgi:hypothetical protein